MGVCPEINELLRANHQIKGKENIGSPRWQTVSARRGKAPKRRSTAPDRSALLLRSLEIPSRQRICETCTILFPRSLLCGYEYVSVGCSDGGNAKTSIADLRLRHVMHGTSRDPPDLRDAAQLSEGVVAQQPHTTHLARALPRGWLR